jgi:hypothetical protein
MGSIQSLYRKVGDNGIAFVCVSTDGLQHLKEMQLKKKWKLPLYCTDGQLPSTLQTEAIPTTFIVSQSGRILVRHSGAAKWDDTSVVRLLDSLARSRSGPDSARASAGTSMGAPAGQKEDNDTR